MQIETLLLSEIVPYETNAKKHPKYQIGQIKESIETFGNNDPIAIDENNVIIEGHGRYLALKELAYDQVPVIRLKHLSKEQKRAYVLAHNKITLNTGFDMDLLKQELTDIMDIDMSLWHADSERLAFSKAISATGWLEKQCLIWVKNSFVLGRQDYQWQHEPCLYGWKPGAKHYFVSDFSLSTVLESSFEEKSKAELIDLIKSYQEAQPTSILRVNRPQANKDHPTMKPLSLIERLVRHSSRQEDVVLDTFAGSGTTLMVCEQLNRVNYSMELDPKYVQGILKRFEREAGIKPKQLF